MMTDPWLDYFISTQCIHSKFALDMQCCARRIDFCPLPHTMSVSPKKFDGCLVLEIYPATIVTRWAQSDLFLNYLIDKHPFPSECVGRRQGCALLEEPRHNGVTELKPSSQQLLMSRHRAQSSFRPRHELLER